MMNISEIQQVCFGSGGTAGHIFPAELVTSLVRKKYSVFWITDKKGARYTKSLYYPPFVLNSYGLSGNILKRLRALIFLGINTIICIVLIKSRKTRLVVGFGGHASLAALFAAVFWRIPIIIHEQNAYLGYANRIVSKFASQIVTSFSDTSGIPINQQHKVKCCGMLVRPQFNTPSINSRKNPAEYTILVIGGSQGAELFSDLIPNALSKLPQVKLKCINIIQQVKVELYSYTQRRLSSLGLNHSEISPFFIKVFALMQQSDIIITRAGASIISEIIALCKPAIFIPMSNSADGHQMKNAQYLAKDDAAIVLDETDDNLELSLHDAINSLLTGDRIEEIKKALMKIKERNDNPAGKIYKIIDDFLKT